jgi:hypothetical protein
MAALLLILLLVMGGYAWLFAPLLDFGTELLRALWLLWLPLFLAIWLLANHDS